MCVEEDEPGQCLQSPCLRKRCTPYHLGAESKFDVHKHHDQLFRRLRQHQQQHVQQAEQRIERTEGQRATEPQRGNELDLPHREAIEPGRSTLMTSLMMTCNCVMPTPASLVVCVSELVSICLCLVLRSRHACIHSEFAFKHHLV